MEEREPGESERVNMGHCSTGSNKIQPDILLVIQKLECVLKMWLRSPTNDLLSFFLFFFSLLFISNQAGICGTRFPRAQVDISARHLCLMTPTCIQGHSQQKMFFSIHNTVKKSYIESILRSSIVQRVSQKHFKNINSFCVEVPGGQKIGQRQ